MMELPSILYGNKAVVGELYFFEESCPKGIIGHMHVLISKKDKYLFLTTCSSQIDNIKRLAERRHWNLKTVPTIKPDDCNHFSKDTYINCNSPIEFTIEEFGELIKNGSIRRCTKEGMISDKDMTLILEGIRLSDQISKNRKDLIL